MPEPENEILSRLRKSNKDVIDYLTFLGTLNLSSLAREADEQRLELLRKLVSIVDDDNCTDGGIIDADEYEVPQLSYSKHKAASEPAAEEKKSDRTTTNGSVSDKDYASGKAKKKTLSRTKSSQTVELPTEDVTRRSGYLVMKKALLRNQQHWAVLDAHVLYLAKSPKESCSEMKIRLHDATIGSLKNLREFELKKLGKTIVFRAESDDDCQSWIELIQQSITESGGANDQELSDNEADVFKSNGQEQKDSEDQNVVEDPQEEQPDEVVETDDVYDDIIATPSTETKEANRTESSSSGGKSERRTSGLFGSKSKDAMPTKGKLTGYAQKKGHLTWDKKWLMLIDDVLYYSNSESDKYCQGTLLLAGANVDSKFSTGGNSGGDKRCVLTVKQKGTKVQLAWDDTQAYDEWQNAIKVASGGEQSLIIEKDVEDETDEPQDYVNPSMDAGEPEPIDDEIYDDVIAESDQQPVKLVTKAEQQKQLSKKEKLAKSSKSTFIQKAEFSSYLYRKSTGLMKKWERKWFFIVEKVVYISSGENDDNYKNFLPLTNVADVLRNSAEHSFGISIELKPGCGKDLVLAAESKEKQSAWISQIETACDIQRCDLDSEEEEEDDGAIISSKPAVAPLEESAIDDDFGIMDDIYEDMSELEAAKKKPASAFPSLPPRNAPPQKLPTTPTQPSMPPLPPRQPSTPVVVEPEPIMEEFYEAMDEVQQQYESAKAAATVTKDSQTLPSKLPTLPPARDGGSLKKEPPSAPKKEAVKKETKKEKEARKKQEKENKKNAKKEKSKTLPKSKNTLKPEPDISRSSSMSSVGRPTEDPPEEEEEEYVNEDPTKKEGDSGYEIESHLSPPPIDDDIYEDVVEPPAPVIKKPTPPPTVATVTSPTRAGLMSPPGTVSNYKKNNPTTVVTSANRSQSVSPATGNTSSSSGGIRITSTSIKVSTMTKKIEGSSSAKAKTPSPTPDSTSTASTTAATTDHATATAKTVRAPGSTVGGGFNKPRVKVSEAIFKFQKRDSFCDSALHKGTLFHKAPGRTKFRQEYCELSGTSLMFYREKGDERPFVTMDLTECELRLVQEQYEGRRHVFSLAAGSAIDLLSAEYQMDLKKWLEVLEPLVKKYRKD